MKTTIELPDALAAEAKRVAAARGTTLRELVVTGLRRELAEQRGTAHRIDFVFPTFDGEGLVVDLAPAEVIARSYGLPG
jgi:hypothetical protein